MAEAERTGEDLPTAVLRERDRVRDVVLPAYKEIGQAGLPALKMFIEPALKLAEEALTEHDVVKLVRALKELREIHE